MSRTLRPGSPAEAGLDAGRIARARDRCASWVKEGHTPSLCVCVARRGVIVLHEAWGVVGPEPDSAPLQLDTLFPIASVTKPVTATLVMQLVDDGLLGVNRPAKDYLPELSGEHTDEILVHHLLTHTSGIPWMTDPPMLTHAAKKLEAGLDLPPCPETQHPAIHRMLEIFWDAPLASRPGEVMTYSNRNYVLLGEIVRRLSGKSIDALARERIFGPLGMENSHYVVPDEALPRRVRRPAGFPMAEGLGEMPGIDTPEAHQRPNAGGGMASTPLDMVRFGQMILNRGSLGEARVLSPAAVAAMTRDQIPGTGALLFGVRFPHASWGYGWAVESPQKWPYFHGSLQNLGALGHPGAGGVMFGLDRERELVAAYFEVTQSVSARMEFKWNFDLFQNMIAAAAED
jgi:CubicO group peptidase (beta-lactamase class C family)